MGDYTVYKVGEEESVRRDAGSSRRSRRPREPKEPRRGRGARGGEATGLPWVVWVVVAAVVVALAAAYWFFGREAVGNAKAALDLAKLSSRVPDWAVYFVPVVALVLVALVAVYAAFGRFLALKIVGAVAVIVVLATPGLAVGYANGLVAAVGDKPAETPQVTQEIAKANNEVDRPLPNKPMNILLIGSDKSTTPGDPGRSDTQILMRLDPQTKSISMLSLPRDLRVDIPGVGYDKMNAAYAYGGPALVIKTFKQITGLPINHWIEVNFAGFWHVVNILGGVYVPVDRRYFVPASADYKSINLQAGYQLVRGKQALNFVRFRHDQAGDFTRMQRQQLFIRELQKQSGRWSSDWTKVLKLIKAITGETKSDLSSLKKLQPLVNLAFNVDTSKVYQAHLEGAGVMLNGISYVEATPAEIIDVVHQFTNPLQAPASSTGTKIGKKMFPIYVYNGSGIAGLGSKATAQLASQGYNAEDAPDATEFPDKVTVVYAPKSLQTQAKAIGAMLWPSDVRIVTRAPGGKDGISVFVASSFDGTIAVPTATEAPQQTLQKNQKYDWASWKALDKQTPLKLEAPTAWSPGMTYDTMRKYSIETTEGKHVAAAVASAVTPEYGYFCVQAMRWLDPPEVKNPDSTVTVGGRQFMQFYQGDHLHLVAWKEHSTLYWIINTLDNQLSNDLMMGLASSCKPVK